MTEDAPEPRASRGAVLQALSREDLDLYGVAELDARIAALEEEIARVRRAREAKASGRAAADALFSFRA